MGWNHAAGQFVKLVRRGQKPGLQVHTGGINCVWQRVKEQLPGRIPILMKKKINKFLWVRVRQWQWRNAHHQKDLLHCTGKSPFEAAFR